MTTAKKICVAEKIGNVFTACGIISFLQRIRLHGVSLSVSQPVSQTLIQPECQSGSQLQPFTHQLLAPGVRIPIQCSQSGIMMDKVALREVSLRVPFKSVYFGSPPQITIPSVLQKHISMIP